MHPLFVDGGQHAFIVCAWFMEFGALVCDMHGWCNASRGFFHGYIKGGLFSSRGFLYLYFSHSEGGNTPWTRFLPNHVKFLVYSLVSLIVILVQFIFIFPLVLS
ncbi:unnamed protein product [Prunus armeniaca]